MTKMSVLSDCLKTISNAEKRGKRQVIIRPSSKVVVKFLQVMQKSGKCNLLILHVATYAILVSLSLDGHFVLHSRVIDYLSYIFVQNLTFSSSFLPLVTFKDTLESSK